MQRPRIITIAYENDGCQDVTVILDLLSRLKASGRKCLFIRSCDHLDIDTPNKDSYELFAAGLDFAMLVTDKHHYLKSSHDISQYLPIPSDIDDVIQDNEVYPHDIRLTISKNDTIITDCGEQFPLEPLTPLIYWLGQSDEQ